MENERWFPLKHKLSEGVQLNELLHGGCDWQIYRLDNEQFMLIVQSSLADRWVELNLLPETVWTSFSFDQNDYRFITSEPYQRLEPIAVNRSPDTKADALAFALSFRETRKVEADVPLHDAIYVERYSRLLPTWTSVDGTTDEEILGRWLSGGVSIPVTSLQRLSRLLGWLGKQDVADVVMAAGVSVSPSSGAAGAQQTPHQPFCLPGRPALEAFFNEHVIDIIANAERYKAIGIDFPSAMVLHGPPGCGKTFAVEQLGEYLNWPIFSVDSSSVASPYIHETSKKIGEIFDQAMDAAPSLVVIDEMESYLSDRQKSTGQYYVEEVAEFLRRIPEAGKRQVLVIGMTNRLEMIDDAILRRGRFDHVIEVGMPSAAEVAALMDALLATVPLAGGVDTKAMVASLAGRALSDTAFVVREARRLAARSGRSAVDDECLRQALASLQSTAPKQPFLGFR